jgi:hypothetical protein
LRSFLCLCPAVFERICSSRGLYYHAARDVERRGFEALSLTRVLSMYIN